jgi:hypothetical protein
MDNLQKYFYNKMIPTFRNILKHGIHHITIENKTEEDYLQIIINIQAAIELLCKMKMIESIGWESIIERKTLDALIGLNENQTLNYLNNNKIHTIQYSTAIDNVKKIFKLEKNELDILTTFQNERNEILHLGTSCLTQEIVTNTIIILVRIFNRLEWYELNTDLYGENQLKEIFGNSLYMKLLKNSEFTTEALKYANNEFNSQKYCLLCHQKTLVDYYNEWRCVLCCYQVSDIAVGFINCPYCLENGSVIYDKLNIDINIKINGLCCKCKKIIDVAHCKNCSKYYIYKNGCECKKI